MQKPTAEERLDAAHWEAVEEATELLHEERFHEALTMLREILRADTKNPYAFYFTGVAMFEVGELAPARDAYRACIALAPKHVGARVALSHVLRSLGEARAAVKEGMAALALANDLGLVSGPNRRADGDALHAIGLAHLADQNLGEARKYLEAFLTTEPEFEVATEVRGILADLGAGAPVLRAVDEEGEAGWN